MVANRIEQCGAHIEAERVLLAVDAQGYGAKRAHSVRRAAGPGLRDRGCVRTERQRQRRRGSRGRQEAAAREHRLSRR
jgi:hypothetical protein